ncbi:MAG TPA: hypothetical protein VGZ73_25535 [Bryobacteraceae bacterium]|nr:hypothetical protein [Bryobacteraceae bacterium]
MGRVIVCLLTVSYLVRAQGISAEALLTNVHREAQEQSVHDRLMLLYDLAIAATGVDAALSARWSLEMYDLARDAPYEQPWQQMNQAAYRKNALTILSLTDPERAAQHFQELEPSPGHQPNEDPRIDLARHLFPRLWAKEGEKSLPTILRFADFTSLTGQYPYVAVGHILPELARVDRPAAHSLCLAAVRRLGEERGIWRTPDDYMKFLRESWPVMSPADRRLAVEAALAVIHRGVEDKAAAEPGTRWYGEYYLPQGTVRFDSEEAARVYDLLPFIDRIDANRGRRLRNQYPALANIPLPLLDAVPWRAGLVVAPGHDTPERVEVGFERYHLMFLREWAGEDAKRAAALAERTKDPVRRRTALALVLPAYAKVEPGQAESWLVELLAGGLAAGTADDLTFLAALARADFALGHTEDGERAVDFAMGFGGQLSSKRDRSRPAFYAPGAFDLHDLAETYGEFRPNSLVSFVRRVKGQEPALRLFLLAGAARGALRYRPGYQEPN